MVNKLTEGGNFTMKNTMKSLQNRLEVRKAKAAKKGAASLETIIVSGLLIALAVGLIAMFSTTLNKSATSTNGAIDGAVIEATEDAAAAQAKQ